MRFRYLGYIRVYSNINVLVILTVYKYVTCTNYLKNNVANFLKLCATIITINIIIFLGYLSILLS